MKKLLYLLLLTPIIYLTSCSSGKDGLSPDTLVGKWERSSVRYNYVEEYFFSYLIYDENGYTDGSTDGGWSANGSGTSYVNGDEEMSFLYGYDRYVIELNSDNTYDEYFFTNGIAEVNTGIWASTLDVLTLDGWRNFPYTKTENSYEISVPEGREIPLDYTSYPSQNYWVWTPNGDISYNPNPSNYPDRHIISDVYEEYVRIE